MSTRVKADDDGAVRLVRLRGLLGLSQRELAAEFGVAHGAIGLWETGRRAIPGPVRRLLEIYEDELGLPTEEATTARRTLARGRKGIPASLPARALSLSKAFATTAVRATAAAFGTGTGPVQRRPTIAQRAQLAIAEQMTRQLGDMKGFAMKIGQMAGYLDFGAPEPVRERLASLQTQSRAMPPSLVAQVFLEEHGKGPRRIFREWSAEPFAAASIGQVHRARITDGTEVAVKVQYPRIVEAVEADLASARLVERATALVFRGFDSGPLVAELRTRLLEECDYLAEAAHQERFRRLLRDRPGVFIPRVFSELSTRRILVSEFARGQTLAQFAARASQAERNRAGELLFDFTLGSLFGHGVFNADPHPGNYLFDAGRVAFLDFGCTKHVDARGVSQFKALARAILERDPTRLRELTLEVGMPRNPDRFDFADQYRLAVALYEPFLREGGYRFTPAYLRNSWRAIWLENRNRFQSKMPVDWLFLPRLQWGLYSVLATLGAEASWRARLLDLLYDPSAVRPRPYSDDELALVLGTAS